MFEAAFPDKSLHITWWIICQGSPFVSHVSSLSYKDVAGICVFQRLIRMVWSVHLHSESCAVQLLLQFNYPW